MTIHFSDQDWQRVKDVHEQWWDKTLERPLIQVRLFGNDAGREDPKLDKIATTDYFSYIEPELFDFDVDPKLLADRWHWQLCSTRYLGDGYPHVFPNFGPGILSGCLGLDPQNSDTTVWYDHSHKSITELDFKFDPQNKWFQRIMGLIEAANERFGGEAVIATTDLGGQFDIMATFTGSDKLVLELFDHPDEVMRAAEQIHEAWFDAFGRIDNALGTQKHGYSAWCAVLSSKPYYIFQCDFAFMLTPDLFNQFVMPDLAKCFAKMPRSVYHLDGQPQLNNLPTLFADKNLDCIEWVPGHGSPDVSNWPDTYKQIQAAGKNNHIFDIQYEGDPLELPDLILEQTGSLKGFAFIMNLPASRENEAAEMLSKHGVI